MAYTDEQMNVASEIAYMNLNKAFDSFKSKGGTPPFLLRDLMKKSRDVKKYYEGLEKNLEQRLLNNEINVGSKEYVKAKAKIDLYNNLMDDNGPYKNWKIAELSTSMDNSGSNSNPSSEPSQDGMYACLIETDMDNAIVGFRGSESWDKYVNVTQDWINGDFKILTQLQTDQQKQAERFMKFIKDKPYKKLALTGHSLGGNLADHAAITASDKTKIEQVVNLDGPNMSNEYIAAHRDDIDKIKDKMKHYQWSAVGNLLTPIPGVAFYTVKIHDCIYNDMLSFERHDRAYLVFENGNLVEGKQDALAYILGLISRGTDKMPKIVGDSLVTIVGFLWESYAWFNEDGNYSQEEKEKIGSALIGMIITGLLLNPAVTISVIATFVIIAGFLLGAAINILLAAVAVELIYEFAEKIINEVILFISNIAEWAKEKLQQLNDAINNIMDKVKEAINMTFNAGYRYAAENPHIKLNTYKLRSYADRIKAVNSKIEDLNHRLNGLYSRFSIWDWWTIAKVDICTEYSWKLECCRSYLYDTAEEFEAVELKLLSQAESV